MKRLPIVSLVLLMSVSSADAVPRPWFPAPFQVVESFENLDVYGGFSPLWAITGRFNGDAHTDILSVTALSDNYPSPPGTYLSLSGGDGHGGFSHASTAFAFRSTAFATADFNGDGIADLALTGQDETYGDELKICLFDNAGTPHITTIAMGGLLASADFNGDGKQDLALVGYDSVSILLGQ